MYEGCGNRSVRGVKHKNEDIRNLFFTKSYPNCSKLGNECGDASDVVEHGGGGVVSICVELALEHHTMYWFLKKPLYYKDFAFYKDISYEDELL